MIDLLETSTLTITSYSAGAYNANGLWVEGTASTRTIKGSIQPLWRNSNSGIILKSLPEGIEIEDIRIVYTSDTSIKPASVTSKTQADRTQIDGLWYYAHRMRKWAYYGLDVDHYEVYFVRLHEGRST